MNDFVQRTPFFRLCMAYGCGILLFRFFTFHFLWLVPLNGCFCFWVVYYYKIKDIDFKLRGLYGCGVFLLFISLGLYRAGAYEQQIGFENLNKCGVTSVEVTSVPEEKPKTYAVQVRTLFFAKDSLHFRPTRGNAVMYLAKSAGSKRLNIGDRLLVSATFVRPVLYGNPEEFDYPSYLHRKGFGATAYADSTHWVLAAKADGFSLRRLSSDCRNRLLNIYKNCCIQGNEYAVLAALTLGYQDEISNDLYTSYSNSGAIHILSVSGLHVGIIYVIFSFLLSFLNKSARTRFIKSISIIGLLWAYAFITGLSPCVMRAALMFSLVAFGEALHYKSQIYNTIFFSAFVLLLINPYYIYDVGFELSYVAVLSIVLFYSLFRRLLEVKAAVLRWCWELLCVSVAAQIGTFPLCLYYFHKFPSYFLLTNFLAIPISTAIIYLAVLLFAVYSVPVVGAWVGVALKWLLTAQNRSIVFVDRLPGSTYRTWIGGWEVLLLYMLIVFAFLFVSRRRYSYLFSALGCLLLLQTGHLYQHAKSMACTELVVYNNRQCTSVDFITRGSHQLFTTDSAQTTRMAEAFWLRENLPAPQYMGHRQDKSSRFVWFAGKRICILTDSAYCFKRAPHKIRLDYLVLGNKTPVTMQDVENLFDVKRIIVDDTFPKYRTEKIREECKKRGILCYSTAESGAYICQL